MPRASCSVISVARSGGGSERRTAVALPSSNASQVVFHPFTKPQDAGM